MVVTALQGDSVDSLCYRHLGSSDAVEQTFELNPGIAAIDVILPMGTIVILPDESTVVSQTSLIQLWD